ncbi:hypothetical protein IQ254_24845 [Nodosilinea sp. LEGE 07088]|uniref:hypothetical protein n=1 Tax=Nodosilinea sp. LEGE 07088 TaxID=2777968 RepID=UPI001880AC0C|nr:hypothetical protein [Nodosilinea sp. LEGE 07088]MBE9140389.1 hypothetical protein [Nodosilinea sp. LEGE 07088]
MAYAPSPRYAAHGACPQAFSTVTSTGARSCFEPNASPTRSASPTAERDSASTARLSPGQPTRAAYYLCSPPARGASELASTAKHGSGWGSVASR